MTVEQKRQRHKELMIKSKSFLVNYIENLINEVEVRKLNQELLWQQVEDLRGERDKLEKIIESYRRDSKQEQK